MSINEPQNSEGSQPHDERKAPDASEAKRAAKVEHQISEVTGGRVDLSRLEMVHILCALDAYRIQLEDQIALGQRYGTGDMAATSRILAEVDALSDRLMEGRHGNGNG